ncbi:SGNH/GDSL hydrolase family protein [Variovorax paradoxus]|uniref:SGNH/GDSL hydrolase family protein n=1 Tax=Variovorax paradoxus TaxID=34073 RepID=UPI001ABC1433
MQKYQNNIADRSGNAVAGLAVTVTLQAGGGLATIYSDNAGAVAPNPLTTDSNGYFEFYAADGRYNIDAPGGGYHDVLIADTVLIAGAAAASASAAQAAATQTAADKVASETAASAAVPAAATATAQALIATTGADTATAQAAIATAARAGAESAQSMALVQAGVAVDEPTGRAAVADGVAFKVQGAGDVAAFEFRRVNSASSTPLSQYPSVQAVMYGPMVTISPESTITIDMTVKTVVIGSGSAFFYRAGRVVIAAQTINFTAADTGVYMRLYYDPNTGAGGMAVTGGPAMPGGVVVLAHIYREHVIANDPDGRVVIVQAQRLTGPIEAFRPLIGGAVVINTQAGNLKITTSAAGFVPTKRGFLTIPTAQDVAISSPSGLVMIHAHPTTGALSAWNTGASPPTNWPLLAVVLSNVLYKPASSNITLITTTGAEYADPARTMAGAYFSDATLTINLATLTLSLVSSSGIAVWNDGYRSVTSQASVAFTMPFPNGLLWVYVNKSTGALGAVAAGSGVPPVGSAVVAEVYGQKLDAPLDTRRLIKLIDTSGNEVPSSGGAAFDPLVQRMILPDTMYFLPSTPMRLFRAPCFADYQNMVRTDIAFWLDTGGTSIVDRFQPVGDSIKIDPAQLGSTFRLGYRHNAQPDKRYIKTITAAVAAPGALAGKSIKLLAFGDSLTEEGMITELKTQIDAQGATVTPVGTYFSASTNSLRGEGRGFWAYRNFIGKDNLSNVSGTPTPHTLAPAGPDTTKFANPCLRLATGTDTTNTPTWCFRNTGAEKELSYTDDPDKTGNFYIFDFGWYRTQHSVPAPDIITIALSTNDINLDRGTYSQAERLQFMRLGLEIMVKSIKADLPSVKIGIIPAPSWCSDSVNDPRWLAETAPWIEQCMKDVAALSGTYSNLFVVGVWPFMSEDWVYPYTGSPPDLSANNNTKVNTIADRVHFDAVGRTQYATAVTAWVANVA